MTEKSNISENLIRIVKGSIISLLLTVIALFIFASLLAYTNLQESVIVPGIIGITVFSLLIGSTLAGLHFQKNGILNGGMIGFIYILVLYLLSSIVGNRFCFKYL